MLYRPCLISTLPLSCTQNKEGKALETNNITKRSKKMETYRVQAISGEKFEDIYVEAKNENEYGLIT